MSAPKIDLIAAATVAALAEMFRALGDGTRVRILDALSRSEFCVGDLADLLGLSESAVSHQLRLLRGLRLVRPRRAGRLVFYTLDDQHVVRLFAQGLEHVEERRTQAFAPEQPASEGDATRGPVSAPPAGHPGQPTRREGVA
jgi:DNA-binding transcriptional ArsR family regulator